MIDAQTRRRANEIAGNLADPARHAEIDRHFRAINAALNNSHVNGEQDALCLFEAMAYQLAQLIGALSEKEQQAFLTYVMSRALQLAPEFRSAGKAASHLFER